MDVYPALSMWNGENLITTEFACAAPNPSATSTSANTGHTNIVELNCKKRIIQIGKLVLPLCELIAEKQSIGRTCQQELALLDTRTSRSNPK